MGIWQRLRRGRAEDKEAIDCVVVGAGLSGLAIAKACIDQQSSTLRSLIVTEADTRPGGVIRSSSTAEGFLWEEGPNSFQPTPALLKAAAECGLEKDLLFADAKAPRFVLWGNKLRPVPSSPLTLLKTDLLSTRGKARAVFGALGLKPRAPGHEESVEHFVRRNLGAEAFERLVEPFCSGVYAGNPANLSTEAAFGRVHALEQKGGSILGGVLAARRQAKKAGLKKPKLAEQDVALPAVPKGQTVVSFKRGMQSLPLAMADQLKDVLRLGWQLQSIERSSGLQYRLTYKTSQGQRKVQARSVILTLPAYKAAEVLQGSCPEAAQKLASISYPPVAAVTLAYPTASLCSSRVHSDGKLPGFGQLHPRSQGVATLGTIYASSLFPGRAPKGWHTLQSFIGGSTNPGIAQHSHEQLADEVDEDLRRMLVRPDAPRPKVVAIGVWPRAIPQFNLGHTALLQAARDSLHKAGLPGLHLAGNYSSGVALGRCVETGPEIAATVANNLKRLRHQEFWQARARQS